MAYAFIFGNLNDEKYKKAKECALRTPNLSVIAFDGAIIGRSEASWSFNEDTRTNIPDGIIIPPSEDGSDKQQACQLRLGDFLQFSKPLKFFLRFWDKPVIYIAGNHEYYGTNMEPAERVAVEWISRKLPNVHYLKNSAVEINGVHFFGGTMWTDFDGNLHCMYFAQGSMNDYRQIRTDKTQRLKAETTHTRS